MPAEGENGSDRRESPRRELPFGRGVVLAVAGREHVVRLVDLGRGGAFLSTGKTLQIPAGSALCLRLRVAALSSELRLTCELVRVLPQRSGRPAGVAVRFQDLDRETLERLDRFVAGRRAAQPGR